MAIQSKHLNVVPLLYYTGAFAWTDSSAVYYANWADTEPNSVEGSEKCTEVYSPNAEWNDVNCQSKRGFICKIKQGIVILNHILSQ